MRWEGRGEIEIERKERHSHRITRKNPREKAAPNINKTAKDGDDDDPTNGADRKPGSGPGLSGPWSGPPSLPSYLYLSIFLS